MPDSQVLYFPSSTRLLPFRKAESRYNTIRYEKLLRYARRLKFKLDYSSEISPYYLVCYNYHARFCIKELDTFHVQLLILAQ